MVECSINTFGVQSLKTKTKDFYKMLIQGLIIYLLFITAFSFTVKDSGYLSFLRIFITMLYLFASVFIPLTLKNRMNKVVREIRFNEKHIVLIGNEEYSYSMRDIIVKQVKKRFLGFSLQNKDGILITTNSGKEFWIVEDFFNLPPVPH